MTGLTPSQSEQPLQRRLLRKQKFQNIQIIEFAGFQDRCQHQVLLQRAFSETTIGVAAILGKAFDGVLGIIMPTPGLCRVGWFLPLATGFLVFAHAA